MGNFYCTVLFHSCVTIFSRSSICYVPVVLGLLDHLIHDGGKASLQCVVCMVAQTITHYFSNYANIYTVYFLHLLIYYSFSIFSYTFYNCIYYFKYSTLHTGEKPYSYQIWLLSCMQYKPACYSNFALAFTSISNYFCCYVVMYDFLHTGEKPYAISNEASPRYGKNLGLYSALPMYIYVKYDFNSSQYFIYSTLHTGEKPYSYQIWLLSCMQIKLYATQILLQLLHLYQTNYCYFYV